MKPAKKITVHVSEDLLEKAQKSSGLGISETIRMGLKLMASGDSYAKLRRLRGKASFSIHLKKMRDDRE